LSAGTCGVRLLVINADRQQVHEITLPSDAERYTLTAKQLHETSVQLNGKTLQLNRDGDVPQFLGQSTRTGHISFAPTSITFLEIANADNSNRGLSKTSKDLNGWELHRS
jgi:heparanase 1